MMTVNPYESPSEATADPEYRNWLPFDIGVFVGRYLYLLAWLSIASMIVGAFAFDRLMVDLSFVFMFWAGWYLVRHHPTARKWVVGVSGLMLLACLAMAVAAAVFGTEHMTISMGRRIDDPPLWAVLCVTGTMAVVVGIPFALLMTGQAKREFGCESFPSTSPNMKESRP